MNSDYKWIKRARNLKNEPVKLYYWWFIKHTLRQVRTRPFTPIAQANLEEETVLQDYRNHVEERAAQNIPPIKAGFLSAIAKGEDSCELISKEKAVELLGNMHGGYNIA